MTEKKEIVEIKKSNVVGDTAYAARHRPDIR